MKFQILHHNKEKIRENFTEVNYENIVDNQKTELIVSGSTSILNQEELAKYPFLKYIIHCCSGTNNIDQDYCKTHQIQIFNSPTANINATAEHTVALILTAQRKILAADKSIREGNWDRDKFQGKEINDCTIAFIGFGNIARSVLKKLSGFNPKEVLIFDPFLSQEQITSKTINNINTKKVELGELLTQADIISLHLPLSLQTKHLIAKDQFNLMKKDSIIVNTSRGEIIEEDDLYDYLISNKKAFAALDVFENEPNINPKLKELKNCILTPHISSMTKVAQEKMIMEAKENFERFLKLNK